MRNLSVSELEQKLAELKEELFNLRFQLATGNETIPCDPRCAPGHCSGKDTYPGTELNIRRAKNP